MMVFLHALEVLFWTVMGSVYFMRWAFGSESKQRKDTFLLVAILASLYSTILMEVYK